MSYFINIDKLTTRLARAHVDPRLVSVGSYAEGCYCIAQNENGVWETFIGERSEKSELKVLNSERGRLHGIPGVPRVDRVARLSPIGTHAPIRAGRKAPR